VRFVWLATVDDAIEAALEPLPQRVDTLVASDSQRRAASG
jgi:hypothetical protein